MRNDIFTKKGQIGKPEKFAEIYFEALKDTFAKMLYAEFERYLNDEMENDYIRLGTEKVQVSCEYKRAMFHYIAFLYYLNAPTKR